MFYDHLTEQYNALRAEQEAGSCVFHLLVGEDGTVLGRFNLVDLEDGTAELGYRVAQQVAGRGVATATVRELCRLAAERYGLRMLRAATTCDNVASQKVLQRAGFVPVGPLAATYGLRTLRAATTYDNVAPMGGGPHAGHARSQVRVVRRP